MKTPFTAVTGGLPCPEPGQVGGGGWYVRGKKGSGAVIFDTVAPTLRQLFETAPARGVCGIDCHFKAGVLIRVTTKTETSALTGEVAVWVPPPYRSL